MWEDPFDKIKKSVVQEIWAIKDADYEGTFTHSLWLDELSANEACEQLNKLKACSRELFVAREDVFQID